MPTLNGIEYTLDKKGYWVDPEGRPLRPFAVPTEWPTEHQSDAAIDRAVAATRSVPDILLDAAVTFRERNAVYGDNYKTVGAVMAALFPSGVELRTPDDFNRWHLFELIVVKLTRFANSGLTHRDSMHDIAVYAAMVESLTLPGATPIPR